MNNKLYKSGKYSSYVNYTKSLKIFICIFIFHLSVVHSQIIPNGLFSFNNNAPFSTYQYLQRHILDESINFVVEWDINKVTNIITFNISARTNGYVMFGLSLGGQVEGSDVIIGGIGTNGESFVRDMHGISNDTLASDVRQDWRLLSSQSSSEEVKLIVSRDLDTCDTQDIIINNDLRYLIWGTIENRDAVGSFASVSVSPQGSLPVYIADPSVIPRSQQGVQTWRISRKYKVPPRHTSYWCSIHRGRRFNTKQHVVGFSAYFQNDLQRRHIHHQLVYRCFAPPGIDPATIFEKYTNHPGEECYLETNHELPTLFCSEIIHIWGAGGHEFKLPDHIGIPIGETPNEYFMLESHYDNPEMRSDLEIENGVDFQYSPRLRPNEGGIFFVGSGVMGLYMVPPGATNFSVTGHCSPDCTSVMFPINGAEIVATMLHSHMTTHSVRMKHIRGNRELPWIQNDGNYYYNYQQLRLLPEPVTIMPGDHLATECSMTTTSRSNTTLSGFATRDEMCVTFVLVNRRMPFLFCSSEYPTSNIMSRYGIQNMTWDRNLQERVVTNAVDSANVGRTLGSVVDENTNWTPETIRALERQQNSNQEGMCPDVRKFGMLAYLALFVDSITGGLISRREQINNSRPSTRSISTPPGATNNITIPRVLQQYQPQRTCSRNTAIRRGRFNG